MGGHDGETEFSSALGIKRLENLDPSRREPERLEEALAASEELTQLFFLKEELSQFWRQRDSEAAKGYLSDWLKRAQVLQLSSLTTFYKRSARTLTASIREGIHTKSRRSNAAPTVSARAAYFRLKILGIHRSRYALVG